MKDPIVERALAALRSIGVGVSEPSNPVPKHQAQEGTVVTKNTPCDSPQESVTSCGLPNCAGCYAVINPDTGNPARIHPPRPLAEWLAKWEPKGRVQ